MKEIQVRQGLMPEEVQVLRDSMFKDFSEAEVKYSLAIANKLNLSPLLRQIHFVRRMDNQAGKWVIAHQTGIDGLRLVAERTGKYAGSDEPVFTFEGQTLVKASVTVYKLLEGQRIPFTASAYWTEFCPSGKQAFMWNKMPRTMLAKCAEAQALRKAFPAEMSGLYADEEMQQAETTRESKIKRIETLLEEEKPQERVVNDEPVVVEEMPPFDEFTGETKVVSLGDYVLPEAAKKFKGKKLSEVNKDEFCQYIVEVRSWFDKEKKPVSKVWKEIFANAESYFG